MQMGFDFGSGDVRRWHAALTVRFGVLEEVERRSPVSQLVKSIISGRTRDPVSFAAHERLCAAFGHDFRRMAMAGPAEVEALIADVTFADAQGCAGGRGVADGAALQP